MPTPAALAVGPAAAFWNPAQRVDSARVILAVEAIQTPSAVDASGTFNGGAATPLGQSTNAQANLVLSGGTLKFTTAGVRPVPRQLGHGSVTRTPSPPQAGHVVATWKNPRDWTT